jgi:hypothetical protein
MKKIVFVFLFLTIFSYCNNNHEVTGNASGIEYTALKDFSFTAADLPSGTPLRILGYSGGREIRSKDSVYLYEFLCVNKQTGDTVKVFSTLISVDNPDNPQPTYTTPHLFDGEKHVYDAVFETVDPQKERLFLITSATADPKDLNATNLGDTLGNLKRIVILNKSLPLMTEQRFKSAFGCLHFKQQPW